MCASCISLLLILVSCALRMGTDGLPISRRERGVHQDIIAGADFLSVLMDSPALRQAYREMSTTLPSVTRLSRSTSSLDPYQFSSGSTEQKSFSNPPVFNSTLDVAQQSAYVVEVTTPRGRNVVLDDANKNDLSAEENEPITFPDYLPEYSGKETLRNNQDVTQSQSIIYHNNPVQSNNGRSVSYSTVIQTLPKHTPQNWNEENQQHHGERKERHYDVNSTSNDNKLDKNDDKYKDKQTLWERSELPYSSTEKNWEVPEKVPPSSANNQRFPIIYGKPEENYEVDEAVSVMSSGRVHGVQPPPNKNDNQKVGYVVEGRNYRKYRVEERTSDGFIVGEYGVVSHDDGSLRGVRYTADGTINPRIVYDALMKFLAL